MRASIQSVARAFGLVLTVASGLLIAPGIANAAVPATLNYQGRMTSGGAPIPDSNGNTVQFRLCLDAGCSSPVWSELWNNGSSHVSTKNGLFNVALGTYSPLAAVAFDQPYWLEVQWTNLSGTPEVLLPRQLLTSAPYAFRAKFADVAAVSAPLSLTVTAGMSIAPIYGFNDGGGPGVFGNANGSGPGLFGNSPSVNGVGVMAQNSGGGDAILAQGKVRVQGSAPAGSYLLFVSQTAASSAGHAIFAFSGASASAAVAGMSSDTTVPGPGVEVGMGVVGTGPIGVVGLTNLLNGFGVVGSVSTSAGTAGVFGANRGSGKGVMGDSDWGVGVRGSGLTGIEASANGQPGSKALQVFGNAVFDGAGNTVTFNSFANFLGGTNLGGGGVPVPLSLSAAAAGGYVLSVTQQATTAGSRAIQAYTPASWTAAVWAEASDVTAPGPGMGYSRGVYGLGSVGLEGRSSINTGGAGVVGSNPSGGTGGYGVLGMDNGTAGIGARGEGYTGVEGYSKFAGGTGVMAQQGSGAWALQVSGNAKFNWGTVDFSAVTVTGMPGIQPPVSWLTPSASPVLSVENTGSGQGLLAKGALTGISATATDVNFGRAIYAQTNPGGAGDITTAEFRRSGNGTGAALRAYNTGTAGGAPGIQASSSGSLGIAIDGKVDANGNTGYGIRGENSGSGNLGAGVYGENGGTSNKGYGVYGANWPNIGVYGLGRYGVVGRSNNSNGAGVLADWNGMATSLALKVSGPARFDMGSVSFSSHVDFSGALVTGLPAAGPPQTWVTATAGAVLTASNTGSGYAITAHADNNAAISAFSANQAGLAAVGVAGYGIYAQSATNSAIYATSTSGTNATLQADNGGGGPAIRGSSGGSGPGNAGVVGQNSTVGGVAVYGSQYNGGVGVRGDAEDGAGVYGLAAGAPSGGVGVRGEGSNTASVGVHGVGSGAPAVGVLAESVSGAALRLSGSAVMDAAGGTITVASFVSFTAGTNLNTLVTAPLALTSPSAAPALYAHSSFGAALAVSHSGGGPGSTFYSSTNEGVYAETWGTGTMAAIRGRARGGNAAYGVRGDTELSNGKAGVFGAAASGFPTGLTVPAGVVGSAEAAPGGVGVFAAGNGYGLIARSLGVAVSATAAGDHGIYARNNAPGKPTIHAENDGVGGTAIFGFSNGNASPAIWGGNPSLGGVGMLASGGGSGGVGLLAQADAGGSALRLSGSAMLDAAPGLSITVASFVSFTAGTNLGGGVPNPLSLTGSQNGGAIITGHNTAATGQGVAGMGPEVGVSGTATLGGSGVGVLGQANSSNGAGVLAVNDGSGPALWAQGQSVGVSASTNSGIAVYGINNGGGGFIPAALFEVFGTNHAVQGRNVDNGTVGTLGGDIDNSVTGVFGRSADFSGEGVRGESNTGIGVKGIGPVGVLGQVTLTGQVALKGDTAGIVGSKALEAIGDATFSSGSVSFAAHVDFSGATVTGLATGVSAPLSLTNSADTAPTIHAASIPGGAAGTAVNARSMGSGAVPAVYAFRGGVSNSGSAIKGEVASTAVAGSVAVHALNASTDNGSIGLLVEVQNGLGVSITANNSPALAARSTSMPPTLDLQNLGSGAALLAKNSSGNNGAIQADNVAGPGIESRALIGVSVTASGVQSQAFLGTNNSSTKAAAEFRSTGSGNAIRAEATGGGRGVDAWSTTSFGVRGNTDGNSYGVQGDIGTPGNSGGGVNGENMGGGNTGAGVRGLNSQASGVGMLAINSGGGTALRLSGSARLDAAPGLSITVLSYVSFTAGTNLGSAALPIFGSAGVGYPGGVVEVTNIGNGSGVKGVATQPGNHSGPLVTGANLTAGVDGSSSVSLSAGVIGRSYSANPASAGVIGLGDTGTGVYGVTQGIGQSGGNFESVAGIGVMGRGLTGVAARANLSGDLALYVQGTSSADRAMEVQGHSTFLADSSTFGKPIALEVVQQSSDWGKVAVGAYSSASGAAAVQGISNDNSSPNGPGSDPGRGVEGSGPIGVLGSTQVSDGIGVMGYVSSTTANGKGGMFFEQGIGTALQAEAIQPSARALRVVGNAIYEGSSSTLNFQSGYTVDFTGANVLGLGGVSAPLSLTSPSSATTVYGYNGSGGTGLHGRGFRGVVGEGDAAGAVGVYAGNPFAAGTALSAVAGAGGIGIRVSSDSSYAISASASSGSAGYFINNSSSLATLYVSGDSSSAAPASAIGLYARVPNSNAGIAVYGATAVSTPIWPSNGAGVFGFTDKAGVSGVLGRSVNTGAGVTAEGGLLGLSVTASSANAAGIVVGVNTGGVAANTQGAILATNYSSSISTSNPSIGVMGFVPNATWGAGVYGVVGTGNGVIGSANSTGVPNGDAGVAAWNKALSDGTGKVATALDIDGGISFKNSRVGATANPDVPAGRLTAAAVDSGSQNVFNDQITANSIILLTLNQGCNPTTGAGTANQYWISAQNPGNFTVTWTNLGNCSHIFNYLIMNGRP